MRVLKDKPPMNNSEWSCYFCGKNTKQRSNLYTHLKSHLRENPWKCGKCGEYFLFPNRLKEHKVTRHPTSEQIQNALKCVQCKDNRIFLHKKKLATHVRAVHALRKYKCLYCYMAFHCRTKLEAHYRIHTKETQHSCYFCGSKFFSQSGHLLHMLNRHLKENPLKCDKCPYRTYDALILDTHKRKIHPDTDKNTGKTECRLCKLWVRKSYLFYHTQSVHGGVKTNQHVCYFCGYRCSAKIRYLEHICMHTRERRLVCDKCPFRALRKDELTEHKRNFHMKISRYICPECPEGYVFVKELAIHLKAVHKTVNYDSKTIRRTCATAEHSRNMPKLETSKTCYFCQKSFRSKPGDFERHVFCHTREKPYKCRICRFSTHESNKLSKHNLLMHN